MTDWSIDLVGTVPMSRLSMLASIGGRGVASIADQASTAAVGFLCSVFIGRLLGTEALGTYAITSVCVILVSAIQSAVVLEPMSVFGAKKPAHEKTRYHGFLFGLEGGVVGLATFALALGSLGAYVAGAIERTLFIRPRGRRGLWKLLVLPVFPAPPVLRRAQAVLGDDPVDGLPRPRCRRLRYRGLARRIDRRPGLYRAVSLQLGCMRCAKQSAGKQG